jgi:hypothetical protein
VADDPNKPPTPIQEWKQAQEGWEAAKRAAGAIPPLPLQNSTKSIAEDDAQRFLDAIRPLQQSAAEGAAAAERERIRQETLRRRPPGSKDSTQYSEKPTVSEGSWYPTTWREAVPLAVWGILVFACGFEFVSSATHGELWPSIYSGVGFVVLLAMLIHGSAFIERLKALDIGWMIGVGLVLFALSIISQRQFEFIGPSADEIAAAVAKKLSSQPTPMAPVATGDTWENLTPAKQLALERALKLLSKREGFQVICVSTDCKDLATSFLRVFRDADWAPVLTAGNAYYQEPVGLTLYQMDIKDRSLAEAIETATGLKIERIVPATLPTESIFIGVRM